MPSSEIYQALAARFDKHHKLPKGGSQLDYISTEQCITRLNDVLGVDGWDFEIREHGCENSTLWALGRLTAYFPERTVAREQFGECATSRGMADGDARKGAASDCLKKCASLIGVALYLSDKDDPASHQPAPRPAAAPARPVQAVPRTMDASSGAAPRAPMSAPAGGGLVQPAHDAQVTAIRAELKRTGLGRAWLGRHEVTDLNSLTIEGAAQTLEELRAEPDAAPSAPAEYREPSEDEWVVWDDKVREQTGYSHGDVCALLGRSPSDHLRALNLSGTPKTGKALIADLIAYKREGRAIPGVVRQPAVIEGEASEAVKHLQSDLQPATPPAPEDYGCQVCGNELEETKFRDGTSWTPAKLAEFGRKKHDMVLCMVHYREMNAAKTGTSAQLAEATAR